MSILNTEIVENNNINNEDVLGLRLLFVVFLGYYLNNNFSLALKKELHISVRNFKIKITTLNPLLNITFKKCNGPPPHPIDKNNVQ